MLRQLVGLATIALGSRLLFAAGDATPVQQQTAADAPVQNQLQNFQNNSGGNSAGANSITNSKPARPQFWFGVAVEKISPAISRQLKLRPDQGLMVFAVLSDSPAARAGLQADDLLIELNGKPLVSQEQLAIAANNIVDLTVTKAAANNAAASILAAGQPSNFVLLREGDRKNLDITPTLRPEQMLVIGNNAEIFSPQRSNALGQNLVIGNGAPNVTNYVAPNGNSFLVGPGYQLDLQSQSTGSVNIRRAISNGERVILTEETDAAGKIHNTITQGSRTYIVDPARLDRIPENIRGLAEQMLKESGQATTAPAVDPVEEMSRQLKDEQAHIESLEKALDHLREKVESQPPTDKAPALQNEK